MLFPTIEFALFFALVFPLTWALNEYNTAKKWFLVAASYFFYAFWNVGYTLILFGSSLFNFLLALALDRLDDSPARRALFWLGVAGNLGLLGYFKYYDFFVAQAMNLMMSLGLPLNLAFIEVALPIAISFLTFHALSYIIDVYHRKLKATRSLVDILLYISFFPHLIAGPIVRAKAFLEQTVRVSSPYDVRLGLSVFLIIGGLFKKVIVANYLSTDFVDGVFRSPGDYSRLDLLLGMYAYAIQIYCDFSAYTDIAIGIANLLGYRFPENFNQPYRALSVQDFWRRWHMTLSSWLRDYLYIPLGGNRGGKLATCRNILITMGLGGLWHGASLNFVFWGLLHGVALVTERMFGELSSGRSAASPSPRLPLGRLRPSSTGYGEGLGEGASPQAQTRGEAQAGRGGDRGYAFRVTQALAWLITFHFVCLAWIFFRSPSLEATQTYFATLAWGDTGWSTTVTPLVAAMLVIGALTQMVPNRWFDAFEAHYDRAALPLQVALPFIVIFLIAVASPGGVPPFIYFQF
jgi:alginate O-acetyltransferase complex protein AlgI